MTIEEYADHYRGLGIRVFPFHKKYEPEDWNLWKIVSKDIYRKLIHEYPWKRAKGLRMVLGFHNERAIIIHKWKWMGWTFRDKLLKRTLKMLNLPSDYKWVISNSHYYAIIVRTKEDFPLPNSAGDAITFIWKGTMVVPSRKWKIYPQNSFYYGFPSYWDIQELEAKYVINCVLSIRKITAAYKKDKPKKRPFLIRIFRPKLWTAFDKNFFIWLLIVFGMFSYIFITSSLLAPHPKHSPFVVALIMALVVSVFMFQPMFDDDDDVDKYFK